MLVYLYCNFQWIFFVRYISLTHDPLLQINLFFNQMFNINHFHIFSSLSCDEVNVILMVGNYDIISWLFDIIIPPFFILIWIFCKIFFWVPPNSILQISSKFLYKIFNIKQFEFTSVFFFCQVLVTILILRVSYYESDHAILI